MLQCNGSSCCTKIEAAAVDCPMCVPTALTVSRSLALPTKLQPEAYVSKLVIVPGIVTAASRPKHKATYLTIQCKECK